MKVYKTFCIITSLLYFYLFYTLLFNPNGLCVDLGLEGNEVFYFLARRGSALMLGFAVLLLLARNLKESKPRAIVSASVAVCMLGLATMSGYEFFRGFVNSNMIPPLVVELTLGLAFLTLGFLNFREEKQTSKEVLEATR